MYCTTVLRSFFLLLVRLLVNHLLEGEMGKRVWEWEREGGGGSTSLSILESSVVKFRVHFLFLCLKSERCTLLK